MSRLLAFSLVAMPVLAGCASVSRPPGGPEDHAPPQIVSISIDTNATNVKTGQIEIRFDEVISERPSTTGATLQGAPTLDDVVLVSPQTGTAKVTWHRDRITIEPRGGFKANTAYRITLLPGIADIRGNIRREPTSFVFTTGAALPPYSIVGRLFDWEAGVPSRGSLIQAIANPGTKDSLTYLAYADSTGQFNVGPLGQGTYLVRGFIDADNNHTLGVLEKWDTVTVQVTDARLGIELLAIQRDTAPPGIQHVEVLDSAWLRIQLDKPYDPKETLQPALVILKRADSSNVELGEVMTEARAEGIRPKPPAPKDTTQRIPLPPPPPIDTISTKPPAAKPSQPPPSRVLVAHLAPGNMFKPDERYVVTVRAIRNLVGHTGTSSMEFTVPKPQPIKPPPTKPPTH